MAVPIVPPEIRRKLAAVVDKDGNPLGLEVLYRFLAQDQYFWLKSKLDTEGDVTMLTAGKGIVVTNKTGTITKRVFLNDAGTDIDIEDV